MQQHVRQKECATKHFEFFESHSPPTNPSIVVDLVSLGGELFYTT